MFVSPNTPGAISFKSKRKRTKGSKKRRIDSLAKTLNIFIRKNAIKLGNDAADDEKHADKETAPTGVQRYVEERLTL